MFDAIHCGCLLRAYNNKTTAFALVLLLCIFKICIIPKSYPSKLHNKIIRTFKASVGCLHLVCPEPVEGFRHHPVLGAYNFTLCKMLPYAAYTVFRFTGFGRGYCSTFLRPIQRKLMDAAPSP